VIICVLSLFNQYLKIAIHKKIHIRAKKKKDLICNLSVKHDSMSAKLYLTNYKDIKKFI